MANSRNDALLVAPRETLYQSVTVSGTSAETANAIDQHTRALYLYADTDCHFRIAPTGDAALATDTFLPANVLVLIRAKGGHVHVIQNAGGGTLHVSEMTY